MAYLHPLEPCEPDLRTELVQLGTRLALAQKRGEPAAAALAEEFEQLYRKSGLKPLLSPGV